MSYFAHRNVTRRIRLRYLLPLLALAIVTIALVPAGAAKPTAVAKFEICVQNATSTTAAPTPDCSAAGTASVFDGNQAGVLRLSIENDNQSNVSLASATVVVPPQLKVVGAPAPSKYVTAQGQTLTFTGLNLPGGKAFTATVPVGAACGGTASWTGAASASDSSGTISFTPQTGSFTGAPTNINTGCRLAFVNQPTDTQSGQPIKDAGASTGNPIQVALYSGATGTTPMTTCPLGWGTTCSVTLADPPGVGTITSDGTLSHGLSSTFVTTYTGLNITIPDTKLTQQYNLTATGDDGLAPMVSSGSFLVVGQQQGVTKLTCTGNSCSSNGPKQLQGTALTPSYVEIAGSGAFTFMTLSPYSVTGAVPDGCTGRPDLGVAGFAESDTRGVGSGTLTIKYFVDMDNIKANFGANTGQQFIPICVGARPVDSSGVIHDCTEPGFGNVGWLGDEINKQTGKFTGKPATAVCNPDGYYWGIISSYQDKLDASVNPVVTSWNGQNINGRNYREFDMSVPSGWDYRGGP